MPHNSFHTFLSYFPEVDLPINISDDYVDEFSRHNTPIPISYINEYIIPLEKEHDDYTEYIPCLRMKDTPDMHVIVYWKGGLLKYEFVMVSFDKSGNMLSRKVIASTIASDTTVKKSVATITEDWIIHIVAGENNSDDLKYSPENSQAFAMELLADGQIIFNKDDTQL